MAAKLWVKSPFKDVQPAVEKFLLQFTDKRDLKPAVDEFKKLYEKARVEQLSPSLWSKISNTESWNTRTDGKTVQEDSVIWRSQCGSPGNL